jgi:enoyl-CoA hydratase/carnithine racemase
MPSAASASAWSTAWSTTQAAGRGLRARQVARRGPALALRNIKDNLDDALHIDYPTAMFREAERLVGATRTADHKEAVQAFVDKRKPVFSGR